MQFFKFVFLALVLSFNLHAADIKSAILSRETGKCETNNLYFTAMRFYQIPLGEKYQDYDLFLRVIAFFNEDGTLSLRLTTQALVACQGSKATCSYLQVSDTWIKGSYSLSPNVDAPGLGNILWHNEEDTNRGFTLTFDSNFPYENLRNKSFIGGMIIVNFNQNGVNTMNLCKH